MSRFADAVREIVGRHPAPAVALHELQELIELELPDSGIAGLDVSVVERLATESRPVKVMAEPRRRWLQPLGPRAWIVDDRRKASPDAPPRTIPERVRRTLVRMGRGIDPESAIAWARWNRLLEEERELRRGFRSRERARKRRERARASRTSRTTIRPPDPRPRRQVPPRRRPRGTPAPRDPGSRSG